MPASLLTIAPDAARLPAEDLLRQSFALAAQAQRTGDLAGAERLYQAILAADPAHADALHGLGTLAHQVGRSDIAADLIGQAIARRDEPMFHNNLGVALLAQGKFPEALAAHRRALELKPAYPEAFHALGNAQMKLGRRDEAIAAYSQALALRPTYVDALCNLGKALQESGENDAAEQACRRALELTPHCAEAHNTLGIVLRAQGRFDEALECFDRALASRPAYAEAHSNRGNVLEDLDRQAEALDAYSRALRTQAGLSRGPDRLRPRAARAWTARGGHGRLARGDPAGSRLFRGALFPRARGDPALSSLRGDRLLRARRRHQAGFRGGA